MTAVVPGGSARSPMFVTMRKSAMHRPVRPSFLLVLGTLALPVRADAFCVQTPGELTAYLFAAGINLEDDEIRIRTSTVRADTFSERLRVRKVPLAGCGTAAHR
jgi:hypothetical protein